MSVWEAIVLGLVQGLTEFLPVSSSGHLVIVGALLGVREESLTFEVMVHFGTLLAVLAALKDDWRPILLGVVGRPEHRERGRRKLAALVVGSLPIAVVGLVLKDPVESLFGSPRFAAAMLLVTGTILWLADRLAERSAGEGAKSSGRAGGSAKTSRHERPGRSDDVSLADAMWIGLGQALAILPGISRSGSTLAAGMARGLDRASAARFAFLLAIPAILGATILQIPDALESGLEGGIPLLIGAVTAGVTGYASIALFLRFLKSGRLTGFALYTWIAGLVALWLVR